MKHAKGLAEGWGNWPAANQQPAQHINQAIAPLSPVSIRSCCQRCNRLSEEAGSCCEFHGFLKAPVGSAPGKRNE